MNDDLNKYKKAWYSGSRELTQRNRLSEEDIMDFITTQSRHILSGLQKSVIFDVILKTLLALSFFILAILFSSDVNLIIMNILLTVFMAGLILLQSKYYHKAAFGEDPGASIKDYLHNRLTFFDKEYIKVIYLVALSSPMFFFSGVLFYSYFKYGIIRPLDMEDYSVFAIGLLLSFIISSFAHVKQYRFQLDQLHRCLEDLDEQEINRIKLNKEGNKRLLYILFWAGFIIITLLVMLFVFSQ